MKTTLVINNQQYTISQDVLRWLCISATAEEAGLKHAISTMSELGRHIGRLIRKNKSLNDGLQQVNLSSGAPLSSSKGQLLPLWPRQRSD